MENPTTSGLRLSTQNPTWYCGRVSPGRERQFQRRLQSLEIPTYFPVHIRNIKRGQYNWKIQDYDSKTYPREMSLFPGYVFVALDPGVWALIRERIAVRPRWLSLDGKPAEIPAETIERLQAEEQNGFVQLADGRGTYREGDELEVSEPGIWYGRRGILASDPDRRVLTLHLIAESFALNPVKVLTTLKIERTSVQKATRGTDYTALY